MSKQSIKITHIENPQLFFYTIVNDASTDLKNQIEEYVREYQKCKERFGVIENSVKKDEIVLAYVEDWKQWVRAKIEEISDDEKSAIDIWAVDHACPLKLPMEFVIPLVDDVLINYPVTNVHIGAVNDIAPSDVDFMEKVRTSTWSKSSIKLFTELIDGVKDLVFTVESIQKDRHYGKLEIRLESGTIVMADEWLCDYPDIMADKTNKCEAPPLDHINYRRIYYISKENKNNLASIEANKKILKIYEEAPIQESPLDGMQPPSESMQLSDENQNDDASCFEFDYIRNRTVHEKVAIVTDEDINRTMHWRDTFYFSDELRSLLEKRFRTINQLESYVWPHIMRGNSAIIVDEMKSSLVASLPVLCANVLNKQKYNSDNTVLSEPLAILLTPNGSQAERLTKKCNYILKNLNGIDVKVCCLIGSNNIDRMMQMPRIDILVASVFSGKELFHRYSNILKSNRLQYIHFSQIDEMCRINGNIDVERSTEIKSILELFFARKVNTQMMVTSETYCPILNWVFKKSVCPLLAISMKVSFQAALFADTSFTLEMVSYSNKFPKLIEKLETLTGSILVCCENREEVDFLAEYLFRNRVDFLSLNKNSPIYDRIALELFISQCNSELTQNILLCDDKKLPALSTQYVQHIVHFSPAKDMKTFCRRYQTCLATYEAQLNSLLVKEQHIPPTGLLQSIIYVDEYPCSYLLDLLALLQRSGSHLSNELQLMMTQLYEINENFKSSRSLCKDLITKAIDCSPDCPYRHTLKETGHDIERILENSFVKLRILDILTPNHYAVEIIKYRMYRNMKWVKFEEKCEWEVFQNQMNTIFQSVVNRIAANSVQLGAMYAMFLNNQPFRCRVIAKGKQSDSITVYLIDSGKRIKCKSSDLLKLPSEFQEFPPKMTEVFLLDIAPNENDHEFTSFAMHCVKSSLDSVRNDEKTTNYITAEVVTVCERFLLVKDFKINEQKKSRSIAKYLIKNNAAIGIPIKLHKIFQISQNGSLSTLSSGDVEMQPIPDGYNLVSSSAPSSKQNVGFEETEIPDAEADSTLYEWGFCA